MASVTECLSQIQNLTRKNLEILQSINDSFFTKQNHLQVNVGDASYVIPSFISLENKLNMLEENFNNLINSPSTGEAYFHVNGNTKAIEVKKYNDSPNSIILNEVDTFKYNKNDIFKDFLTPVPYINFKLMDLPNDIVSVNVKKIIPINTELINTYKSLLGDDSKSSISYKYSDIYKILSLYKEDIDYIEYDVVKKLPIRKTIGGGVYIIEDIKSDVIDTDLNNYITLKLKSDVSDEYISKLTYRLFDETIEKPLSIGDELVTFDGTGKMEIVDLYPNTNTIKVRVLNGDFLNLVGTNQYTGEVSDLSKIKFFSPINFDEDKNINIPLEEDRYLFIAIAPLNDRMNIQSGWGTGVIIDTYSLKDEYGVSFDNYYNENVKNIGDILFEITSMMDNTLTKFTDVEFNNMTTISPNIDVSDLSVVRINNHLNNSTTVKNIKSLYSQKKRYNAELSEIQIKIDDINKQLSTISFDDTSNLRSGYVSQLSEYNNKKNELVTSITKIIDEISKTANDSEVPIENAKYRIRGFFDYESFIIKSGLTYLTNHINGIKVQYRYKTVDQEQGNAISMNKGFIFSDWNDMDSFILKKEPSYINGYKFSLPKNNSTVNEPSFNQIDIPISQGETVDIRLKVLYDFGYPFIETSSDWSDIVNIKFPDEYLKDIQILDIISENNNDIETNRFNNILNEKGVTSHITDELIDQDITYYHKPDNIASGFYTNERRVIPLKTKLEEMNNSINNILSEIGGGGSDSLSINIMNGDNITNILPWENNAVVVEPYYNLNGLNDTKVGVYEKDEHGVVSTILNIVINNISNVPIKLYPLFPGNKNNILNNIKSVKFDINDYCIKGNTEQGIWIRSQYNNDGDDEFNLQTCNQFITFRMNDPYGIDTFYNNDSEFDWRSNKLSSLKDKVSILGSDVYGACMYPYIKDKNALCLSSGITNNFIILQPNQEIIIPILYEYKLEKDSEISKTLSFDLRTSLYNDPINYMFTVTSKYNSNTIEMLSMTNRKHKNLYKYHSTIVK